MNRALSFLDYSAKVGQLFGIPIRLHITLIFFVLAAFPRSEVPPLIGLEWIAGIVLSILLHELGHALTARHYRMSGLSIMIHGFGGFATSSGYRSPKQQLVIVLMGPAVTFALGGLLYGIGTWGLSGAETEPLLTQFWIVQGLGRLNLIMGVLNMVPCLPWDGGQALQAIMSQRIGEFKAMRAVAHLSLIIGPPMAIYGFAGNQPFLGIFGLMGTITAYQILASSGGIRFGEFFRDWRARKEMVEVKRREREKFETYIDDVRKRERDREERERLRKLFEVKGGDD